MSRFDNFVICRMFYASNVAGAAAINGIIDSLRHGEDVHRIWLETTRSGINYQFNQEISLQGAAHYALGLFYRLVPDSSVIEWVFGIRGSLTESVNMHRKSVEIDGPSSCNSLMLAVSLICAKEKEDYRVEAEEINYYLDIALNYRTQDLNQKICIEGSKRITRFPELACGYTTSKQQVKED